MKILCYIPAVLIVFFVALAVYPSLGNNLKLSETKNAIIIGVSAIVWSVNMVVYLKRKIA